MKKYIKPFLLPFAYFLFTFMMMAAVALCLFCVKYDSIVFSSVEWNDWGDNYVELIQPYLWVHPVGSGLLLLLFAYFLKMSNFKHAFDFKNIDWRTVWIPIVGATFSIWSIGHLYSILDYFNLAKNSNSDVKIDSVMNAFMTLCFGSVFVAMVFREAVIRYLLSKGTSLLHACICSVFCYSILYLYDYMQLPYVLLQGTVFVILYVKTGSVVLETIFLFLMFVFRFLISPTIGIDYELPLIYHVVLFIVVTPPAIFLLWKFWKTPIPDGRRTPFDSVNVESAS